MLKQVLELQEQERSTAYFAKIEERRKKAQDEKELRAVKRKHHILRQQESDKLREEENQHEEGVCDGINPDTKKKCKNYRNLVEYADGRSFCHIHRISEEDEALEDEERELKRKRKRRRLSKGLVENRG
jgi:hypothetical protein